MSDHLGELATALVDGQLGHSARDRALGHLARCPGCRGQVEQQRALQVRLRGLAAPPVPAGLAQRLLAMPQGPMGGRPMAAPGTRPRPATFRPTTGGPGRSPAGSGPSADRSPARPAGRRRRRRTVVMGGTSMLLGLGLLVAAGGGGEQSAVVNPGTPRYVVEHVSTSTEVPLGDPGMTAVVTVSRQR